MTPGHPADPPCLGTILPCDLVALGEFWKSEGPSGQGTCSGMSGLHDYIVQRHSKKMQEGKTTNNYNDLLKLLFYEMQGHKMCNETIHICNEIWRICNVRYSRQSPDRPWRTSVNTDSKEKSVVNLSIDGSPDLEKFFVLEKEYRVP